jgi:predicted transporter
MPADLRKVSRRIWLLIGGGSMLFIACALALAMLYPQTPANALVDRHTVWLFVPSAVLVSAGVYVSLRYWRCPHCGWPLTTRFPIPRACPRCGRDIGL